MDSNDDGPASSNDGGSTQVSAAEGFEGFDHKHGPLHGVKTSCLRWREMLRRDFGVVISDGDREAPSTDDGELALSTDDREQKAPTADSEQDSYSPMPGLAGTNNDCLSDGNDPDMPELGDSDDGNDDVDVEQTSPAFSRGSSSAHTNENDAVACMAFSPRTLTDVDELLGEALAGPEKRSDVKDGAASSSSSTAPPTNTATTSANSSTRGIDGAVNPHQDCVTFPSSRPLSIPWESLTDEQKMSVPKMLWLNSYNAEQVAAEGSTNVDYAWRNPPQIEVVSDDGVDMDQEDDVFAWSTYETTSPPQFFEPAGQTTGSPLVVASSSAFISGPSFDATVVHQPSPSARAERKANKAPRDINGNIDSSNVIDGKRHRNPRPPHHASHSVKLAVDDDCCAAAASNEPEVNASLSEENEPFCLFTHVLRMPEKQKRMDANVVAARQSEIKGLYDAKCVRWATRQDAKRDNITPIHTGFVDAIKQNESTGDTSYTNWSPPVTSMNCIINSPCETSTPVAHHFTYNALSTSQIANGSSGFLKSSGGTA
eukprot:g7052.t1